MGFYTPYKTVFDSVKAQIETKSSIKTVVLGEQFTRGNLPKAFLPYKNFASNQNALRALK